MWELGHKEGWVPENWCFGNVMLEKTLKSPLDCKEIKPVNPKGNQPWIFIGRTDAEAEAPILWSPEAKSQLIGKDPDAWKDWGQEKRATEDEMVRWHHWLNGHEFEQTPRDTEGQGSLVCCGPWGRKESDTTEQLNNNNVFTLFCLKNKVLQNLLEYGTDKHRPLASKKAFKFLTVNIWMIILMWIFEQLPQDSTVCFCLIHGAGELPLVSSGNETLGAWRCGKDPYLPLPPHSRHIITMEERRPSELSDHFTAYIVSGADQPQNRGVFILGGSLENIHVSNSQSVFLKP